MVIALLALLGLPDNAKAGPSPAAALVDVPPSVVRKEAEALWVQRGDEARLREGLAAYERLLSTAHRWHRRQRPFTHRDRDALYHLVRGYTFLGESHLTDRAGAIEAWAKAIGYGEACLAINSRYARALERADGDPMSAASALRRRDVPCAYWTSVALGDWAKAGGLSTMFAQLPTIKAYMTEIGSIEDAYNFSGPDRFWGAYCAGLPSFAGQDLDKSKKHLDRALEANPDFLPNHVLLASAWAIREQDRAAFERELTWVIAADATVIPGEQPEMEAAQRKARALLAEIDDFFAN